MIIIVEITPTMAQNVVTLDDAIAGSEALYRYVSILYRKFYEIVKYFYQLNEIPVYETKYIVVMRVNIIGIWNTSY